MTVRTRGRVRLAVLVVGLGLVIALRLSLVGGGSLPQPPPGRVVAGPTPGDPFAYRPALAAQFVARATAGNAQPLFVMSPGGALATAARVAAWRPLIDQATRGTGIDPNLLEALVFVESAGRPQVIAGSDPVNAAGLTQIVAQTGQSLLGMHIDLARSRRLTNEIDQAEQGINHGPLSRLFARRAAADARFNPSAALAATVRYVQFAERQFGREDLAFESYHMGIGNLRDVLALYDGGRPVPYVQLYFDVAPDHHGAAYNLIAGFGDDSWLYYWRLLGAEQVMYLYRTDRAALSRLSSLELASDSTAQVLHPPGTTENFGDPAALAAAYQNRTLVPVPANALALGLAVNPSIGSAARQVGGTPALYRGLRPVAMRLLIALAARVRSLSGDSAPLQIYSLVSDRSYQRQIGEDFPAATNGYTFQIERHYVNGAQAGALQAMLDRLQSLNLIGWAREPSVIDVTVASDAGRWVR